MKLSGSRIAALLALDVIVFAIAAFVLLQFMPKPLKAMDYFMVGGVATLISLLSVWLLLLREVPNREEFLYKKRVKKIDGE